MNRPAVNVALDLSPDAFASYGAAIDLRCRVQFRIRWNCHLHGEHFAGTELASRDCFRIFDVLVGIDQKVGRLVFECAILRPAGHDTAGGIVEQNLDPLLSRKIQLDRFRSPRLLRITRTGNCRISESFTGSVGRSTLKTRPLRLLIPIVGIFFSGVQRMENVIEPAAAFAPAREPRRCDSK